MARDICGGAEGQQVWDMININTCFKHNFPENLPAQYQLLPLDRPWRLLGH